jgi:hypothetical protein
MLANRYGGHSVTIDRPTAFRLGPLKSNVDGFRAHLPLTVDVALPALNDVGVFLIVHGACVLGIQAYHAVRRYKYRMTLVPWQRSNILGALNYLKNLGRVGRDARAEALAQGLLEVLEPSLRAIRLQREGAQSAAASAQGGRERRLARSRRLAEDRRKQQFPFDGPDRRSGRDRRSGDRRGRRES